MQLLGVFEGGAGGNFLQKVSPGMPLNSSEILHFYIPYRPGAIT